VNPLPIVDLGVDTSISAGTSIILNAGNPGATYIWAIDGVTTNDTIQTITVSEEGTYSVTVTDINGCENTGSIIITIEKPEFIIYNTFTPNGDGYNDTWRIKTIELYPGNTVEIYNRNGNLVYKNEKGETIWEWDGKYYNDGIDLPASSYYYIINLKDGRMFTGVVTIIR
ncbi:unnamed protein product, partial [marine sediment metagenome]